MLVALSELIMVFVDSSVWGFEGIIQRFEATAISTNLHGIWGITKEHNSFIAWSFLAYRAVMHNGGFVSVEMVPLSYRTACWHADRLCIADLRW